MNINTKEIKQGIVKIDNTQIIKGQPIDFLEEKLGFTLKSKSNYCSHALPLKLTEDGHSVTIFVLLKDDSVDSFEIEIEDFTSENEVYEYLDIWLKDRNIETLLGSNDFDVFYETDFGAICPTLAHSGFKGNPYSLFIKLKDSVPTRKFSKLRQNKKATEFFTLDGTKYKIQKTTRKYNDIDSHLDWLGNTPLSILNEDENYTNNDRMEVLKFLISKVENEEEFILGAVEFVYMAVLDAYSESDLFFILDGLSESFGILGYVVEELGCNTFDKSKLSPYILLFQGFHNEIPHNKELDALINKDSFSLELFKSICKIASRYVNVPAKYLTTMNISYDIDELFDNHLKLGESYVNYDRF